MKEMVCFKKELPYHMHLYQVTIIVNSMIVVHKHDHDDIT